MDGLLFFLLPSCPHCKLAKLLITEVIAQHPEYASIQITEIDESKQVAFANRFAYYYVPSFYFDGVKLHEGHAEKADIERVFAAAAQGVNQLKQSYP
ncbi:MAG: thioredoxin [Clostridia bacterium]